MSKFDLPDRNPWSLKSNMLKQILRTFISSVSRPQASLIPSKSMPSYVSSFLWAMLKGKNIVKMTPNEETLDNPESNDVRGIDIYYLPFNL